MNGLLVFIEMKRIIIIFFFEFKMADSKKSHFPAPPILNIFSWKFYGLVLGLVELIDEKGIFLLHLNENKQPVHMRYHLFQNFDDYPGFQPKTTFLYYYAHNCIDLEWFLAPLWFRSCVYFCYFQFFTLLNANNMVHNFYFICTYKIWYIHSVLKIWLKNVPKAIHTR